MESDKARKKKKEKKKAQLLTTGGCASNQASQGGVAWNSHNWEWPTGSHASIGINPIPDFGWVQHPQARGLRAATASALPTVGSVGHAGTVSACRGCWDGAALWRGSRCVVASLRRRVVVPPVEKGAQTGRQASRLATANYCSAQQPSAVASYTDVHSRTCSRDKPTPTCKGPSPLDILSKAGRTKSRSRAAVLRRGKPDVSFQNSNTSPSARPRHQCRQGREAWLAWQHKDQKTCRNFAATLGASRIPAPRVRGP